MDQEQRQEVIRLLQQGEGLSPEWARILCPPEKREYELVYHGKEREEDILANTLAVPLQPARTFGKNGDGWHNLLIFGDNLQVMKSLLEIKRPASCPARCVAAGRQHADWRRRQRAGQASLAWAIKPHCNFQRSAGTIAAKSTDRRWRGLV
jgi:hypothetical protein